MHLKPLWKIKWIWSCSKQNDSGFVWRSKWHVHLALLGRSQVLNQDLAFRNGQFGASEARKPITRDRTGLLLYECGFIERLTTAGDVQLSIFCLWCWRFKVWSSLHYPLTEERGGIRRGVYEAKVLFIEMLGMLVFVWLIHMRKQFLVTEIRSAL